MRYVLIALLLALVGCGGDEEEGTVVDCSVATNWTTVGAPFVYTWCTPCHSPSLETLEDRQGAYPNINFGTYEDVVALSGAIENVIFEDAANPMPPGGGPSPEELDAVAEWIACGMPE